MANSAEILQRALNAWGLYTKTYERYALLNEALAEEGASGDVLNYFLGSLERHVQSERIRMLEKHWDGGVAEATPVQASLIAPPSQDMVRVNGIVGFYGVNRVFLFLYVHAYLWDKVLGTGPLPVLENLLDELSPR